ncbi:MAG: leucyl aminopeptidase [Chloroflexota bacterium]|nr:leucyl aminopeptidase [Chloroflexota bacterium]
MRVAASGGAPWDVAGDVLAVAIYRDEPLEGELAELDRRTGGAVAAAMEFGELANSDARSALVDAGSLPVRRVLLVDAGRRDDRVRSARRTAALAVRRLLGREARRLALWMRDGADGAATSDHSARDGRAERLEATIVGAFAGSYRPAEIYGRARDDASTQRGVEEVVIVREAADEDVRRATAVAEGVLFGRDLANRSANDLTPARMGEAARELEADGCVVEVLDVDEMRRQGMGALVGVGQGSANEPQLVVVRLPGWNDANADRRLAIVGKGVCFDSGGLSLKPAEKMEEMKWDKSGAAAVIAAARTVARIRPDVPLMAVAPMVENMPGGAAQRPGDVVRTLSGKTVEVTNTDAEGRLILADALAFAEREGATHLVDIATLTGAAQIALGDEVAAVFSRPAAWGREILDAGESTGEWLWEMPLVEDYRSGLDSAFADLVNSGTRDGSLIKSALFLAEFVTRPWAHIDIAGSAYVARDTPFAPRGCLGTGVTTLTRLALRYAANGAPAG